MTDRELIDVAVVTARGWWRNGFAGVAAMLAAGWRGQPYRTECRPRPDGVGGDYFRVWDADDDGTAGESRQARGLSKPAEEWYDLLVSRDQEMKAEAAAAEAKAKAEAAALARAKAKAEAAADIERLRHMTGRGAMADLAAAFARLAACSE